MNAIKAIIDSIKSLYGGCSELIYNLIWAIKNDKMRLFFQYYFKRIFGWIDFKKFFDFLVDPSDTVFFQTFLKKFPVYFFWSALICFFLYARACKKQYKLPRHILKRRFSLLADGVIFGRFWGKYVYSPTDCEGHIGVFAGSGAGKTYTIATPTLKHYSGHAFVLDISGDIASKTARKKDLRFNIKDRETIPYNVFGEIDKLPDKEQKIEALELLAKILIPDAVCVDGRKTGEDFYEAGGQDIFTAYLIAFYFQGLDFIPICRKFYESTTEQVMKDIDATGEEYAIKKINAKSELTAEWLNGQKNSATTAIDLFGHKGIFLDIIRRPCADERCITPAEIEKCSIYFELNDESLRVYSSFLALVVGQMLEYLKGRKIYRHCPRVLLMLDEFTSFRLNVNDVNEAFQKYRKKHVRIMILMQSTANLDGLYGETKRREIMSNIDFIALLGNINDLKSRQYFSQMIGQRKVKQVSKTNSYTQTYVSSHSRSESETNEYIIDASEIDRLGRQKMILINNQIKPYGFIKLKKTKHLK